MAGHASAEKMDFALERLVTNAEQCRTSEGQPVAGTPCEPDNDGFMSLINQFGMAVAPSAAYPARTTGYGGFEVLLEGTYTSVNRNADYMKAGTRGPSDKETGVASSSNNDPSGIMQFYSLRLRKGFGFGLETGLVFGSLINTSLIAGGLDLRWAIFEGFRDGIPGYFPDIAFAGSVRTITGTSQVQLTVASAQVVLSKPITLLESGIVTPWIGYQHLFIFGDSGVIDLTPSANAVQSCGLVGPDIPGTEGSEMNDGSPICRDGTRTDFNNNRVFKPVRLMRQRLIFGANYRYEILTVGAQVMADVFGSARGINSDAEAEVFEREKEAGGNLGNFAFALQVGTHF